MWNPADFTISNVTTGSALPGFTTTSNVDNTDGWMRIAQFTSQDATLAAGQDGDVVDFTITATSGFAAGQSTTLKLAQSVTTNGSTSTTDVDNDTGPYTLNPAPTQNFDYDTNMVSADCPRARRGCDDNGDRAVGFVVVQQFERVVWFDVYRAPDVYERIGAAQRGGVGRGDRVRSVRVAGDKRDDGGGPARVHDDGEPGQRQRQHSGGAVYVSGRFADGRPGDRRAGHHVPGERQCQRFDQHRPGAVGNDERFDVDHRCGQRHHGDHVDPGSDGCLPQFAPSVLQRVWDGERGPEPRPASLRQAADVGAHGFVQPGERAGSSHGGSERGDVQRFQRHYIVRSGRHERGHQRHDDLDADGQPDGRFDGCGGHAGGVGERRGNGDGQRHGFQPAGDNR